MCFLGAKSVEEEITPDNYRELLDEEDNPAKILTKLGDMITIEFSRWNHVEGRVEARPVKINDVEIILEDN